MSVTNVYLHACTVYNDTQSYCQLIKYVDTSRIFPSVPGGKPFIHSSFHVVSHDCVDGSPQSPAAPITRFQSGHLQWDPSVSDIARDVPVVSTVFHHTGQSSFPRPASGADAFSMTHGYLERFIQAMWPKCRETDVFSSERSLGPCQ